MIIAPGIKFDNYCYIINKPVFFGNFNEYYTILSLKEFMLDISYNRIYNKKK